ncbi:MAG: hypothetical protein ACKOOD_05200 [Microbacteriaceae bacterium]
MNSSRNSAAINLQRIRRKTGKTSALRWVLVALLASGLGVMAFGYLGFGSQQVLVATAQILPGDALNANNTAVVSVDLGQRAGVYLRGVPSDSIAVRAVGAGEFIPESSSANSLAKQLVSLAIELNNPVSTTVQPGDRVDVFATEAMPSGQVGEPEQVASAAWVRKITTDSSMGQRSTSVELSFSPDYLSLLLTAMARGDELALVASGAR